MTRRVVVDVDYVFVDDVNYDQTTRLQSGLVWKTTRFSPITLVRIIGSTLSKKIAGNLLYFTILFVYLLQIELQIAGS